MCMNRLSNSRVVARWHKLSGPVIIIASLCAVMSNPAAAALRQPVLVGNEFPAPAASRDLDARVHTAIRGPAFLFGDTGDSFRSMRDSPQKGPHRLNDYIKNLRAYARDDGQLEIRFNIVADEGDTFIWPSQVPARLFVRLFDQNGMYLTHFMTRESFAPAESIVRELTTGAIGLVNPSPVLLLDSDGKSNVLVYTVNARDLDYARSVEVGFYLRPVDASEMRGVPEDEQWLPPGARRPEVNCADYMKCLAPKAGLRSPNPSGTSASGAPVASPAAATAPRSPKRRDLAELLKSYASATPEQRADLIAVLPGDVLSGTAALNRVSKENSIVDRCSDVHIPDSAHWPNCTMLRLQAPEDRPGASPTDSAIVPVQLVAPGTIVPGELGHALLPDGRLTFTDCRIVHAEDWFGRLVLRCDLPADFRLANRIRSQDPIDYYEVKSSTDDIPFVRSLSHEGKPVVNPWTLPGTVVLANDTFTNTARLVDVSVTMRGLPPIKIGKAEFIELKTEKDGQVTDLTRREQGVGTIAVHGLRAPIGAPRIAHIEWLEDWGGTGPVVSVGYMFVLLDTGAVIGEGSIDSISGESINTSSAQHYTAMLIGATIHVVKYTRRWQGRSATDAHPPLALAVAGESFDVSGAMGAAASSLVQWLTAEARWFRERDEATSAQKAACSAGKARECDKFRESLEEIVDRYKRVRDRAGQARTGSLTRASPHDVEEFDKLLKTIGDHVRQSM